MHFSNKVHFTEQFPQKHGVFYCTFFCVMTKMRTAASQYFYCLCLGLN